MDTMTNRSPFLTVTLAVALAAALGGCGDSTRATPTETGGGEPVATTARALAAVAAEHAGTPDSAVEEGDAAEEFGSGGVGTELRYGADGEDDGDMLVVAVGTGLEASTFDCDAPETQSLAGCVRTDEGTLMWEAEAPEEDPGVVYVVVEKGKGQALLFYAGPAITGDPRELDLPISTDVLFAIATDPRVGVTTDADTVAAGADLPFWQDPGR
jgi:hypothetical protein